METSKMGMFLRMLKWAGANEHCREQERQVYRRGVAGKAHCDDLGNSRGRQMR